MKREVVIYWSKEDQVYVVNIHEGITGSILMTHGNTLVEAFAMGKEALELYESCEEK